MTGIGAFHYLDQMRPLRLSVLLAAIGLTLSSTHPSIAAVDYGVFPLKVKIAVRQGIFRPNDPTDLVVSRKLGNNDIINLALGRPLGSKVDSKREVLAVALTFEDPSDTPLSKVIVFDPSQNGPLQIKAVVLTGTHLDFDKAYLASKSQGAGTGTGVIHDTIVGDFTNNRFISTTLVGGGEAAGTHLNPQAPLAFGISVSGKARFSGRIKFAAFQNGVPVSFDGFIVKGEGKASGKAVGAFSE